MCAIDRVTEYVLTLGVAAAEHAMCWMVRCAARHSSALTMAGTSRSIISGNFLARLW